MLSWLETSFNDIINAILLILPNSPIQTFITTYDVELNQYLGYINWFIPIGTILDITLAWIGAITIFYLYQTILRWVRVVE